MEYNISFILVEPATAGNIGSAARAIKTMGFSDLRLVKPCDHLQDEARWLAHGSNDILENAKVFERFEEAISDIDLLIGTTAKSRSVKADYYDTHEIKDMIVSKKDSIKNIAIVFGREESGLTNEELQKCHIASSVPLATKYPSINLAQSVMIYAHALSPLILNKAEASNKVINETSFALMIDQAKTILDETKIRRNENLYNRIIERMGVLKQDDINLMLSVIKALSDKK